jgi:hypothetical protein
MVCFKFALFKKEVSTTQKFKKALPFRQGLHIYQSKKLGENK